MRAAFALIAALVLALGVAACGGGNDNNDTGTGGGNSANLIKSNSANKGIQLTVGSKNFTEEYILGNIYAQALQAAGYDVKTNLNLGSETIAYKALQDGQISGYPEYTSTLLESIFGKTLCSRRRPAGLHPGEAGARGQGPDGIRSRRRLLTRTPSGC